MDEIEKHFIKYKYKRDSAISKGLNDFNLLTTVLKYHDEVRLHSKMICALLDSQGTHYKSVLFLELFLKVIGLPDDWFKDIAKVEIKREYRNIDIYLTDGEKHLVIENKIWAKDQKCQIIRYINEIVNDKDNKFENIEENEQISKDKIRVLYLTPRAKKVPSEHKVDKVDDNNSYIYYNSERELKECSDELKNYKVWYKKITYKDEILNWIKDAIRKTNNVNLKVSLEQYKVVVQIIRNDDVPNVIDFYHYIKNLDNKKDVIESLWNYNGEKIPKKEITSFKAELLYRFFRNFEIYFLDKDVKNVNYEVSNKNSKVRIYSKKRCKKWFHEKNQYRNIATFYELNNNYLFCVFAGKINIHFGIIKHRNYEIIDLNEDEKIVTELVYRSFKRFKWFSIDFKLKNNLNMLYAFDNFMLQVAKRTIESYIDSSQNLTTE